MAVMRFTKAQQNAIDVDCGNILVSAAAGSGKTAVLTQRVVDQIVNGRIPADRFVIVTFTVAASIEMKQRISDKLAALIEQQPEDQYLQEQQLLLSKAKISTIHSLCSELLRDHFQLLGLPAGWRIAEENELKILKADLLEEVIEEYYEQGDARFLSLADFLAGKDDRVLLETVMAIYDFIRSYPFPLNRLEQFLRMYESDQPVLETLWGKLVAEEAIELLQRAEKILSAALERMTDHETVVQKYGPAFETIGKRRV